MTKTQSQSIKDKGSALRRTATQVRKLAESISNEAERLALSKAATIIEAQAREAIQAANVAKAEENRMEDDIRKALPEARRLAATLPMETTVQKLAVMKHDYSDNYILSLIRTGGHFRKPMAEVMQTELAEALESIAKSMAYRAAKNRIAPEITTYDMSAIERAVLHPITIEAAALFDRIVAAEAAANTAPCQSQA